MKPWENLLEINIVLLDCSGWKLTKGAAKGGGWGGGGVGGWGGGGHLK